MSGRIMSQVHAASFRVNLDELRRRVLENQRQGNGLPQRRDQKIYVTPTGQLAFGEQVPPGQEGVLAEVPQGTFASSAREAAEMHTARTKMPATTRRERVGSTGGYLYDIRSEFGDDFTMFAYYDGDEYQVQVVFPRIEGVYGIHDAHLWPDGRICFGDGEPLTTLEQAYAKSVLWATGFSSLVATGRFQFSINNL